MDRDEPQSRVIYVPERGLPILAPPQHSTVVDISNHEMEYIDLGVSSGYSFVSYHPTRRHPLYREYVRNDYFGNIYRGLGLPPSIVGPCFVVVSKSGGGTTVAQPQRADGVVNADQPAPASMLHLRLLSEQIYREAAERAQQLNFHQGFS